MDRERLKEVHKTDTTESRVNEDFVDWLKTKGPTWLLAALVAFTAYLGIVRWRESRTTQHIQAWRALADSDVTGLPSSYEAVAEQYPKIDSIAHLARLRAAQRLLLAVQLGERLQAGLDDADDSVELTELDREQYLDRADRQYQTVLDADDGSWGMTLHAVNAYNGRAAVAEARANMDTARSMYLAAAQRAEKHFPQLAEQSRHRADTVDQISIVTLPAAGDVPNSRGELGLELRNATIERPSIELLMPGSAVQP